MIVVSPSLLLTGSAAYLLGCINTGYYLVRHRTNTDLRRQGSGSAGARNAGRVLGRRGFAIVLLGDAAKGAVAVGLARALGAGPDGAAVAAVAVVLGHVLPAQLGFRGGKGAASAMGALLVLEPWIAVVALAVCAVIYAVGRRGVQAGLATFLLLPLLAHLGPSLPPSRAAIWILSAILLFAHRENLLHAVSELRSAALARSAH